LVITLQDHPRHSPQIASQLQERHLNQLGLPLGFLAERGLELGLRLEQLEHQLQIITQQQLLSGVQT
jgi:hypothetical protein